MVTALISLAQAHAELSWPKPEEIRNPVGAGARVFATLARDKIGRALAHFEDASDAVVGVLTTDPHGDATEPPLSVVVEFQRSVNEATLRELHRLAWNYSHSPAVITLEPGLLRVWTCCEAPDPKRQLSSFVVHELEQPDLLAGRTELLEFRAAQVLHWINFASGQFFSEHANRFDRNGRADQMLLRNLRHMRAELERAGLRNDDICHDLLARIIFVQFLFDRKDSDGKAALTPAKLARLHSEGILRRAHENFASVRYLPFIRLAQCPVQWRFIPRQKEIPRERELRAGRRKNALLRTNISRYWPILSAAMSKCQHDKDVCGHNMLLMSFL